ncbi:MAG: hypothetical protein HY360_10085 [Verrucomicrobia bacterium]|nr:hypothetical protein [Verrucomicrobiota bacterium]
MNSLAAEIRDDIRDSLQTASFSSDIWRFMVLDHPERQRFADGMQRFIRFFEPTLTAHYVNFIITLARLYDCSADSFSLNRFFDLIATNPNPGGKPIPEICTSLKKATPVGRRLYLVRSKRIAHRTDKMLARDIYQEASLTYDDTHALLLQSQAIFSDLSYHLDETHEDFSETATPDFRALLNVISRVGNA